MNFAAAANFPSSSSAPTINMPTRRPYAIKWRLADVVERAKAYGMPGEIVDGNDVAAVYLACQRAIAKARAGEGPTFLEFKTMRMHGHSEHDAAKYVPRELLGSMESQGSDHPRPSNSCRGWVWR